MVQSKAVVATGFPERICHGFWVSVGIGWGIGGRYREYSMSNLRNHFYIFGTLSSIGLSV